MIATFDLETSGLHAEKGDEVFMASLVIDELNQRVPSRSVLLTRVDLDPAFDPDCQVIHCEREDVLIETLARLMAESRAVFATGWNILGFDLPFLAARSLAHLQPLSWMLEPITSREKCLQSSAIGRHEMTLVRTPGLIWIDGLVLARKSPVRNPNFKLKTWATWAGVEKLNVDIAGVNFGHIDRDEATRVGEYCVRDAVAARRVLEHMVQPREFMALTTRAGVPPNYTMTRGQGILVFSLVAHEAVMHQKMVVNTPPGELSTLSGSYQGATVIAPEPGLFGQGRVVILDFSSLYPSLMISKNLCTSLIVTTCPDADVAGRYASYHTIALGNGTTVVFRPDAPPGVIPCVLTRLLEERAAIKKRLNVRVSEFELYAGGGQATQQFVLWLLWC
jgi:DNA polymerase delta subunit 1